MSFLVPQNNLLLYKTKITFRIQEQNSALRVLKQLMLAVYQLLISE